MTRVYSLREELLNVRSSLTADLHLSDLVRFVPKADAHVLEKAEVATTIGIV